MRAALNGRYGLDRPSGPLALAGAVIDPFIYAGVAYLLLSAVFDFRGIDRYQFLLIGFISLRWTLSAIFDARALTPLQRRLREAVPRHRAMALVAVMVPSTLVMALSMAVALMALVVIDHPEQDFGYLWVLPLVLATQGVWNLVAILVLDLLRRRSRLRFDLIGAIAAGVLWFLSPVMYRFEDLPAGASLIFTSFNPVSHLLAAYYNTIWFGNPVSLNVLPAALLSGVGLIFLFTRRRRRVRHGPTPERDPRVPAIEPTDGPVLVILQAEDEAFAGAAAPWLTLPDAPRFVAWDGEPHGYTGAALVDMLLRARGHGQAARDQARRRIENRSQVGRLFDDDLAIYPDWALSQLAFAVAVESGAPCLVLDSVLDAADLAFVNRAWRELAAETAAGRQVIVISRRLLALSAHQKGRFVAVRGRRIERSGPIEEELESYYDDIIEPAAQEPR